MVIIFSGRNNIIAHVKILTDSDLTQLYFGSCSVEGDIKFVLSGGII